MGVAEGEGDGVAVTGHGQGDDVAGKGVAQGVEIAFAFAPFAGQVDDGQPSSGKTLADRFIKWMRAGGGCGAVAVEGVHHDYVGIAIRAAGDVVNGIVLDDAKTLVVWRQEKLIAEGNDGGTDFDGRDRDLRQVTQAVFGQRPPTEAEHQNLFRLRHEKEKGHHVAGVVQFKSVWLIEAHDALQVIQSEIKRARMAVVDDKGFFVFAAAEVGKKRFPIAAGSGKEADDAVFGQKGAGKFE